MKKDVIVEISGTQMLLDSNEPITMVSNGTYYKRNGKYYVKYEEITAEGIKFNCMIKADEDTVEVTRNGPYNSCLVFNKDRCCMTPYNTPFGTLMVGITTKNLIILEDTDILIIKVNYLLSINYDHVAECNTEIKVTSAPGVVG